MAAPKVNKNVMFLVGAVVLGIIAALLSVSYIRQKVDEATAAANVVVDKRTVVVPRRDLAVGDTVAREDLVRRSVPVDFVPADAVTEEMSPQFVGRMVRAPIKAGTPLSASTLVPVYDQFSRVIGEGRVGYTLSVNENNSISGMISPGDRVDILLSYEEEKSTEAGAEGAKAKPEERVAPLLENVLVLATGARVGEVPGEEGMATSFSSISLELEPHDAERLTMGQKAGDLRVLLRNIEDHRPFGMTGLTEKALRSSLGGVGAAAFDDVQYIIGGK